MTWKTSSLKVRPNHNPINLDQTGDAGITVRLRFMIDPAASVAYGAQNGSFRVDAWHEGYERKGVGE
jgi:hypothetical protein